MGSRPTFLGAMISADIDPPADGENEDVVQVSALTASGFSVGPTNPFSAGSNTETSDCLIWEIDGGEVLD